MRKNQAGQIVYAELISKTDGEAVTSGTTTVYVAGDGGAQGAGAGSVAHAGQGLWLYAPTQAETNYNHVAFTFVNSAAVTVSPSFFTVSFDPHAVTDLGLSSIAAIKASTDQIPAVKTSTDQVPAIKTSTDQIPAIKTSTDQIPAVKAKTDGLPSAIPRGVAFDDFSFPMLSTSGQAAPGKTVTAQISKNGGAFAASTNAVVEVANGVYTIDLTAAELNAADVMIHLSAPGCQTQFMKLLTR